MSDKPEEMSAESRLKQLNLRIKTAEEKLTAIEQKANDPIARVERDLVAKHVFNYSFITVAPNYYEFSLAERASVLNCKIPQLCKSIIFENTMCDHSNLDDVTNARYYCVIIQYISKINTIYLRNLIHELRKPEDRISKKKFHFQLASEEDNDRLSGFQHNAIAPFGLKQSIPIVVCNRCVSVENPSILMLGGGKVDVKLAIPTADLIRATNAIVGHISDLR